jgi:hypothetical protein
MPTYVMRDGKLVLKEEARISELLRSRGGSDFPCPMYRPDIQEYHSPIDGKLITSRSHRREDLKANDCIEWEPGIGKRGGADKRTPGWSRKHQRPIKDGLLVR